MLHITAENSTAITCDDRLVVDGIQPTEEMELLPSKLQYRA